MTSKNKIDIILPNYNSYKFIDKTIKSILSQSFKNWKLIIVDDFSDKKTIEVLKKYKSFKKIKIFFLKSNNGDGFCRKFGIQKSKSEYIAFIDSDDIWAKNKLKLQYNFMKKHKFDFTYTYYTAFKEREKIEKKIITPNQFNFDSFIKNTSIATSSMIVKGNILKKITIKLSNSPNFDDYYLKCQILRKIKFAYCLKKNLLNYRISFNSLSSNKVRNLFWLWKINKVFNKLNFFNNLTSVISISINSLKKYGLK